MSKDLGKRLAKLRKAADLNQQEFQRLCGWGDGTQNGRISNYESGRNEPSLADIRTMAGVLDVTPSYLAFGTQETLSPAEETILFTYRNTNDQGRQSIESTVAAQPIVDDDQKAKRRPAKQRLLDFIAKDDELGAAKRPLPKSTDAPHQKTGSK